MKTIKNASIKHVDIWVHGFRYHLILLDTFDKDDNFFDDIPSIFDDYNHISGLVKVCEYHKN